MDGGDVNPMNPPLINILVYILLGLEIEEQGFINGRDYLQPAAYAQTSSEPTKGPTKTIATAKGVMGDSILAW